MIILDTNVVSELMRAQPDGAVLAWVGKQNPAQLHLTAFTVAEIRRGLVLLPKGRRRTGLEDAFETFLMKGFADRILPFTERTTRVYTSIYRSRKETGLSLGELDLLIAAIVKEHDARLATRNSKDFEGCGLRLINPWRS